jgi:hypothetical protein
LSVEAVQETAIEVAVALVLVKLVGADGGDVSGGAPVDVFVLAKKFQAKLAVLKPPVLLVHGQPQMGAVTASKPHQLWLPLVTATASKKGEAALILLTQPL